MRIMTVTKIPRARGCARGLHLTRESSGTCACRRLAFQRTVPEQQQKQLEAHQLRQELLDEQQVVCVCVCVRV